jgi:hypothetical protein
VKKLLLLFLVWALGSLGALMFLKEMTKVLEMESELEKD